MTIMKDIPFNPPGMDAYIRRAAAINQCLHSQMASEAQPPQTVPGSAAKILHQGYIIELADGGHWLRNGLTWTPIWDERGVWHELADAELAIARSLSPNTPDEP